MKRLVQGWVFALIVSLSLWSPIAIAAPVSNPSTLNAAALFDTNCAGCHAQGGNIIRRGKTLKLKALIRNEMETPEAIANIVTYGKNNMSAFANKLTEDEIQAVSAYVLKQAQQGWS